MPHDLPRTSRDVFLAELDWRQGEHVTLIGPTGQGKTTLALLMVERRSHVVALASKPKDATLSGLTRKGWVKAKRWAPRLGQRRILLWPPYHRLADKAPQAAVFRRALDDVFAAGGWCVLADDLPYLASLGLGPIFETYWYQGRSVGLSLVVSTQRPRHVPLLAYSQATHLVIWQTSDQEDLRRIGGINGANNAVVRDVVATLPKHEALYVNSRTGTMTIIERTP